MLVFESPPDEFVHHVVYLPTCSYHRLSIVYIDVHPSSYLWDYDDAFCLRLPRNRDCGIVLDALDRSVIQTETGIDHKNPFQNTLQNTPRIHRCIHCKIPP